MWFLGKTDEGGNGGFDSGGEVGGRCEIHGRQFGVDGAVVKFGGEGVPGGNAVVDFIRGGRSDGLVGGRVVCEDNTGGERRPAAVMRIRKDAHAPVPIAPEHLHRAIATGIVP